MAGVVSTPWRALLFALLVVLATGTTSPTRSPTPSPTPRPTQRPTTPTIAPTAPTVMPTGRPTRQPTAPTIAPTTPTIQPTAPTVSPTSPTLMPTGRPTLLPTAPTIAPTAPTKSPTTSPTLLPTAPTATPTRPTTSPTDSPTLQPTAPTAAPTRRPTTVPTEQPTTSPTRAPTPSLFVRVTGEQVDPAQLNQNNTATLRYVMPPQPVNVTVSYSIDWGNGQLTPQAPVNVSLPATSTPYAVSNASVPFTPALARDGLVLVGPSSPRASIRFTLRSSYPATTTGAALSLETPYLPPLLTPPATCYYGQPCTFKWASRPAEGVVVAFASPRSDAIYYSGGSYSTGSGELSVLANWTEDGSGQLVVTPNLDSNLLQTTVKWTIYTMSGRFARRSPSQLTITCRNRGGIYRSGPTCAERQNLTTSMGWGILTTMLSVVAIVLFLYGDWAARLTDAVERKVVEPVVRRSRAFAKRLDVLDAKAKREGVQAISTSLLAKLQRGLGTAGLVALLVAMRYLFDLIKMYANGYILLRSFSKVFRFLDFDVALADFLANLSVRTPPFVRVIIYGIARLINAASRAVSNLMFIDLFKGVTCEGSQAPLGVLNNVTIALVLLILYNGHFFELGRITFPSWAKRWTASLKARHGVPGHVAGLILQNMIGSAEAVFKYAVQVFLSLFVVRAFVTPSNGLPVHASTELCDKYGGHMDSALAATATFLFWVSILPIAHLVLRMAVPGVPQGRQDWVQRTVVRDFARDKRLEPTSPRSPHQSDRASGLRKLIDKTIDSAEDSVQQALGRGWRSSTTVAVLAALLVAGQLLFAVSTAFVFAMAGAACWLASNFLFRSLLAFFGPSGDALLSARRLGVFWFMSFLDLLLLAMIVTSALDRPGQPSSLESAHTTRFIAQLAALLACLLTLAFVAWRSLRNWAARVNVRGIKFRQVALAECCLKGLGYVTQSEHRTSKWLLARYKDAQLSPRTQSPPGSPDSLGSYHTRAAPKSPTFRELRDARRTVELPAPWPSEYSTFRLIRRPGQDTLTWKDLESAERRLRRAVSEGRIDGESLEMYLVTALMGRCQQDRAFRRAVQVQFIACALCYDKDGRAKDQVDVVLPDTTADEDDGGGLMANIRMDYPEFKHFVRVLSSQKEVPTYLEMLALWAGDALSCAVCRPLDVDDAVDSWRAYFSTMIWKFEVLLKLTFSIWDTEVMSTFRLRDRVEEFVVEPERADVEYYQDMISCLGQTRCLIWQLMAPTVVLSKVAEALNETPVIISDKTQGARALARKPGKRGRLCVESALPAIAPMLPSDRNGRGWGEYAQELSESRLPYIIINVLKLLTTLVIIALPADFWLPTYVALTFPLRFVCTTSEVWSLVTELTAEEEEEEEGEEDEEQDDDPQAVADETTPGAEQGQGRPTGVIVPSGTVQSEEGEDSGCASLVTITAVDGGEPIVREEEEVNKVEVMVGEEIRRPGTDDSPPQAHGQVTVVNPLQPQEQAQQQQQQQEEEGEEKEEEDGTPQAHAATGEGQSAPATARERSEAEGPGQTKQQDGADGQEE